MSSEYINATGNPELFVSAHLEGKKVFADLPGDTCIEHNGQNLIYIWPCHRFQGDYRDSLFPGLFKRNDPHLKEAFKFYDQIKD